MQNPELTEEKQGSKRQIGVIYTGDITVSVFLKVNKMWGSRLVTRHLGMYRRHPLSYLLGYVGK